jgi:hypothetical protein
VAEIGLDGVTTCFRKAGFPVLNPFFFDILYFPLEAREDYCPWFGHRFFDLCDLRKAPADWEIFFRNGVRDQMERRHPTTSGLRAETALFKEG